MNIKDISVLLIPIAVALLPFIWGFTSSTIRRRQFRELILRELEEIGPHPKEKDDEKDGSNWSDHHADKKFIHTQIFSKPTENRDFILSLKSNLVYYVNQLWNSKSNPDQWIYFISMIEKEIPFFQFQHRGKIRKIKIEWYVLMKEYHVSFKDNFETKFCPKPVELSVEDSERIRIAQK